MESKIDLKIAAKLFEIKKNQLKMVHRRGYDISREENVLKTDVDNFLAAYIPFAEQQGKTFRNILTQIYKKADGQALLVYYADTPPDKTSLGVDGIKDVVEMMRGIGNAIIITAKSLSPDAVKNIRGLVAYNIQVFMEDELSFDPTEHVLVPEHIPLTREEQQAFLSRNDLSIDQLPSIKVTDPIIRYYGMRPGDIVQINRTNMYETMITYTTVFRAVID